MSALLGVRHGAAHYRATRIEMGITSIIATVKESVDLVRNAQKIANSLKHAELKSTIAELSNKLADANLELAELKGEIRQLTEENVALRPRFKKEEPKTKWGCYVFENDDHLYCPACYDTGGKKHATTRLSPKRRQCMVCQAVIGS
jgi:uncharacterized coiled-coil protein SlyX